MATKRHEKTQKQKGRISSQPANKLGYCSAARLSRNRIARSVWRCTVPQRFWTPVGCQAIAPGYGALQTLRESRRRFASAFAWLRRDVLARQARCDSSFAASKFLRSKGSGHVLGNGHFSAVPSGLALIFCRVPNVETLGYCRKSLRDYRDRSLGGVRVRTSTAAVARSSLAVR